MLYTLLSLIAMECFRRVVEAHIKDSINVTVGYRKKTFLQIVPGSDSGAKSLNLSFLLYNLVLDFLTSKIHNISSSCIILSTGSFQISVLNLTFQVTLLTYDARASKLSYSLCR